MPYRILVCCFALLCLVGCRDKSGSGGNGGGSDPNGEADAPQISAEIVSLGNKGIAALENKEWADAETLLSELAEKRPNDRLALRNLAISRVISLTDKSSPYSRSSADERVAFQDAMQRAKTAIQNYQARIPDSFDQALCSLFMGKLLVQVNSLEQPTFDAGLKHLRTAARQEPNRPEFLYAVANAMSVRREYSDRRSIKPKERLQILSQIQAAEPENLSVLVQLLRAQAQGLMSQNAEVVAEALKVRDVLQAAKGPLAPFNESILRANRLDMADTIDKCVEQFDPERPTALMRPAMLISNVMAKEVATQIDLRRIDKDLLEYVLVHFDANDDIKIDAATECVVSGFSDADWLPDLAEVTQLQLLDFDLDSDLDLFTIRNGQFELHINEGGTWTLANSGEVAADGFLLADIDRDYDKTLGDITAAHLLLDRDGDRKIVTDTGKHNRWFDTDFDVLLWNDSGVELLRNELSDDGNRTLQPVDSKIVQGGIRHVTAADLDHDGDLDFAFATMDGIRMWRNLNGTEFADMSNETQNTAAGVSFVDGVDWDRNISMDLLAVTEDGSVGMLQNMLHSRFRWMKDESGLKAVPGGRMAIADFDHNRTWDIASAGEHGLSVTTMRHTGETVTELATRTVSSEAFTDLATGDFDNDGLTDILAWGSDKIQLFRNTGAGFEAFESFAPSVSGVQDVQFVDVDNDGDLDVAAATAEGLQCWSNEGGNSNSWMKVVARGKPDDPQHESRRVNAHATNAVLELRCGADYQAVLIKEPVLHIGLGASEKPDSIRIIWTDGIPQHITTETMLRPDVAILAPQILKGSCPYIYTWTGERFEFFSDCLWAAPIGLVQANGELAPTREWENLLIPSQALASRDGHYELQLTEELWEIAYFDHVELTAIDHPAAFEIFTNEKVGPPSLARHRVHTVRQRRLPRSITDRRGNDLLPGLKSLDGDYVQPFTHRILQGLTDEWTMEFDLGSEFAEAPADDLRLFLTGWIFPTDTSLNLHIEQNDSLQPPMPPVVEIPAKDGSWKVARPFVGFPSGKTKAMVVDLSGILTGGNTRFRLRSTQELYFDEAFFTVKESDANTVSQSCDLVSADLHYRGFSRRRYDDNSLFRNGHAPEGYDYSAVTVEPRWPAIDGRFTRYGDATPLIEGHDDHMVVMGPGDELTLRFKVPSKPLPEGWVRDFVLRNVGYDKDADLNTVNGQSSEPFPRKSMSHYPYTDDDVRPDAAYDAFVEEWQTRTYDRKSLLRLPLRN